MQGLPILTKPNVGKLFWLVPGDFTNVLQHYTTKGYRVLGLAWKPLDSKLSWHHVHRVTR